MLQENPQDPPRLVQLRDSYINLLENALTMTLWNAADGSQELKMNLPMATKAKQIVRSLVSGPANRPVTNPVEDRQRGRDWPKLAHTMIGAARMKNIRVCLEDVLRNRVPGDVVETGVWRGGACIFMRGILKAHGVSDRIVWVADSFEGLPPPNAEQYPADASDVHQLVENLAISLEEVQANFAAYGLLDDQVRFLKGWFKDTLPNAPIDRLALVRLDGDMYESTMDGLTSLWPKLSPGGYLIVDDYGVIPSCRAAVDDFRRAQGIDDPIRDIDGWGVFWQRSR